MNISKLSLLAMAFCICLLAACRVEGEETRYLKKADRTFEKSLYQDSRQAYEDFLRSTEAGDDRRWRAWNRLVIISRDVYGDFSRAMKLLETMRLEFGFQKDRLQHILFDMGQMYQRMGEDDKAVDAYTSLVRMEGGDVVLQARSARLLSMILVLRKDIETAREVLNSVLSRSLPQKERQDLQLQMGRILVLSGMDKEAEKVLAGAASGPDAAMAAEAGFSLADLARQAGRYQEAMDLYLRFQDSHPNPMLGKRYVEQVRKKIQSGDRE